MPRIIQQSISILSDAGLGMAMFSLGKSHLPHSCLCVLITPMHSYKQINCCIFWLVVKNGLVSFRFFGGLILEPLGSPTNKIVLFNIRNLLKKETKYFLKL